MVVALFIDKVLWGLLLYDRMYTSHSHHRIGISLVNKEQTIDTIYTWYTLENVGKKPWGVEFLICKNGRYLKSSIGVVNKEICKENKIFFW